MNWGFLTLFPLILTFLWQWITQFSCIPIRNQRVILLISHPDDEAMFFAPTLLALTRKDLNNQIFLLCFSTGNADGLGSTRVNELFRSAHHLGIHNPNHIRIINDTTLPDSITIFWPSNHIANIIANSFPPALQSPLLPNISASLSTSTSQHSTHSLQNSTFALPTCPSPHLTSCIPFDIIITFDKHGVSYHPNHQSLHSGAQLFVKSLQYLSNNSSSLNAHPPVRLFTLRTVNILRKYTSFIDALITFISSRLFQTFNLTPPFFTPHCTFNSQKQFKNLIIVNDIPNFWTSQRAMVNGHPSQMRWFRWLWLLTSRYMIVNELYQDSNQTN